MAYTTKGAIEKYLINTIDSSYDAQIAEWITAAQQFIDNFTGRSFEATSAIRYFDGSNLKDLFLDDFVSITAFDSLKTDGTVEKSLVENTDYYALPYNDTPKTHLRVRPTGYYGSFPSGTRNMKITASWGYSTTVPELIKNAATKIIAGIIQEGDYKVNRPIKSEKIGDYAISYEQLKDLANSLGIEKILEQYKKIIVA